MTSACLKPNVIVQTTNAIIDGRLRARAALSFTVTTSSMLPALAPGDKLQVRAASAPELRRGDIVLRRIGENWIAHRLIRSISSGEGIMLVTKGDNSLIAESPWAAPHYVGVVVSVEGARSAPHRLSARLNWSASLIACLSRSQLAAARIKPNILRRLIIKASRACLQVAAGLAA